MTVDRPTVRLGTRASTLARAQAGLVSARLAGHGLEVEEVLVRTQGDRDRQTPAIDLDRGAFVAALERALIDRRIDIAVHSAKDLPTDESDGVVIAAFPDRADPRDAVVGSSIEALPAGARVGTGSPRRRAFLLRARADLTVVPIRGNVDTRISRLDAGDFDAVVLAAAGLDRLGLAERATERVDVGRMIPAVGQGALAVQVRLGSRFEAIARALDDPATRAAVLAERAFLRGVGGGCRTPLAGYACVEGQRLQVRVAALDPDGARTIERESEGSADAPEAVGARLAEELLAAGAASIIAA